MPACNLDSDHDRDGTGVSEPMLSKIENARTSCSLTTVARIAAALDVPATALFRGADTHRDAVFVPARAGARIVQRGSRVGHDYTLTSVACQRRLAVRTRSARARDRLCGGQAITVVTVGASTTGTATRSSRRCARADSGSTAQARPSAISW